MANRPKPVALKVIAGTARRDRGGRTAPKLPREVPKPPAWMSTSGKATWRRVCVQLESAGVLTAADRWALEILVSCLEEFRELHRIVEAEGRTYTTKSTAGEVVTKRHPAAAMLNRTTSQLRALLQEFGMSPASRITV